MKEEGWEPINWLRFGIGDKLALCCYWNGLNKDRLRVWILKNLTLFGISNMESWSIFEVGIFKWCVVWLEFKLYQECKNFRFVKELVFDVWIY